MTANLMERLAELEKRVNECCESVGKNEGVVQDQVQYNNRYLFVFNIFKVLIHT